ncbi:MAG: TonB-dependent receptor plug domain-containing protein [Pseudoxanthomonas sp.]
MSNTLPLRRGRLATFVCIALYSGATLAQTANSTDPVDLDTVQVNAYRAITHASSATKTDTAVTETAQSISVIGREELDARGAVNLNEAMRYVAGVVLESTGADTATVRWG